MDINMSKEEVYALHNHLARQLRYFRVRPLEWDSWRQIYNLDELDNILKRLEKHIEKGS